eukprot:gb/GECH01011646.1/.p1 GENE.gb/GECH01011646.1/~~gb/GECH01011646.1/.p1  ORF type:complete len:629 (+),score=158.37 gb/GECH01011646.1/:1-1887(+)
MGFNYKKGDSIKNGSYIIENKIGKGSFGSIFQAQNTKTNEMVAIKTINVGSLSPKEQREAHEEGKILSYMEHPNIIRYYDSFIEHSILHIVMELAERGSLAEKIKKQHPQLFPEKEIWSIFLQMTLGMKYIHQHKILHRDMKSLNIFLTHDGIVKIGDFGVAKILKNTKSMAKTFVGTPYYLSPELCENRPYNEKSDIWALGCILYELCTLKHPFDAKNQGALLLKIMRGKYAPISSSYSSQLSNTVRTLMARDINVRPSAQDILSNSYVQQKAKECGIDIGIEGKVNIPREIPHVTPGHVVCHPKQPRNVNHQKKRPFFNKKKNKQQPKKNPPNSHVKRKAPPKIPHWKIKSAQSKKNQDSQRSKSPNTKSSHKEKEIEEVANLPSTLKFSKTKENESSVNSQKELNKNQSEGKHSFKDSSSTPDRTSLDSSDHNNSEESNDSIPNDNQHSSTEVIVEVSEVTDLPENEGTQEPDYVQWKVIEETNKENETTMKSEENVKSKTNQNEENEKIENDNKNVMSTTIRNYTSEVNRLLDESHYLREQISKLNHECVEWVSMSTLVELYQFFKKISDSQEEIDGKDIQQFVYDRIPFEKAEIVGKVFKLIYAEDKLAENELAVSNIVLDKK